VIAFLADENLKRQIFSGLLRKNPSVDIVRAQEVGLTGIEDRILLEWAARHARLTWVYSKQTTDRRSALYRAPKWRLAYRHHRASAKKVLIVQHADSGYCHCFRRFYLDGRMEPDIERIQNFDGSFQRDPKVLVAFVTRYLRLVHIEPLGQLALRYALSDTQ
jgi:Domain of unknown function (DUF5615)